MSTVRIHLGLNGVARLPLVFGAGGVRQLVGARAADGDAAIRAATNDEARPLRERAGGSSPEARCD